MLSPPSSLLSEILPTSTELFHMLRRPLALVSKLCCHLPQWDLVVGAECGLPVTVTLAVELVVLLRHAGPVLAMAARCLLVRIKLNLL